MADTKITDLTELTAIAPADLLAVVDVSDTSMAASGTDKKITVSNLLKLTVAFTGGTTQALQLDAKVDVK